MLTALLDSDSRNDLKDENTNQGSWKQLRVADNLDGREVTAGSSPEWAANAAIGHYYAICLDKELAAAKRSTTGQPIVTGLMPWGSCLPVRINADGDTADKFLSRPIGSWFKRYLPEGTTHPYRAFIFYELMTPTHEDSEGFAEDTRDAFSSVELKYLVDVFVPIEFADLSGPSDKRMPDDAFFRAFKSRSGHRTRLYNQQSSSAVAEGWHICRMGEAIDQGIAYVAADLKAMESDPSRMNRFFDSYLRALLELIELDKGNTPPTNHACRSVLAKDYWKLRHSCTSFAEFRAADGFVRLLVTLAIVYCAASNGGSNGGASFSKRLENALVRFIRAEYQLGWATEHMIVDLLNTYDLDCGRVPRDLCNGAVEPSPSAASVNEDSKKVQSLLLTVQPTEWDSIATLFSRNINRGMPPLAVKLDPDTPEDLKALSMKRSSGCAHGTWVRDLAGNVCHRTGASSVLAAGESFVVAERFPTRFYFVRNKAVTGSVGSGSARVPRDAYHAIASKLHELLLPRPDAPLLKPYVLPLVNDLELVVYPGIVFESLAALRLSLGPSLTQEVYHTVAPEESWRTLPPSAQDNARNSVSLINPQPSVEQVMHGVRITLMSRMIVDGSDENRYAYDADAIRKACGSLKRVYSMGHPSAPPPTALGTTTLPPPTVYWMRPRGDAVPCPKETLPRDSVTHIDALPLIDSHNISSDRYGHATVVGYRDMPLVLSEHVRALIREARDSYVVNAPGNWEGYLAEKWGSKNPAEQTGHVRAFLAALRGKIPLADMATAVLEEDSAAARLAASASRSLGSNGSASGSNSAVAASSGSMILDLNAEDSMPPSQPSGVDSTVERIARAMDHTSAANDTAETNAAFLESLRKRQEEIMRGFVPGVAAVAPPQPNGLDTAEDLHQRTLTQGVKITNEQRLIVVQVKALDAHMDKARVMPQRFSNLVWGRYRNTMSLKEIEDNRVGANFIWSDLKTRVGGKGPLTLLAYTYAVRIGNAPFETNGDNEHHVQRTEPGYVDLTVGQIFEGWKRNKAVTEKFWNDKAAAEKNHTEPPPMEPYSGPLGFVRIMSELVAEVSKTWPKKPPSWFDWSISLLDPWLSELRREEEAARKSKEDAERQGHEEEHLLADVSAPARVKKTGAKPAAPNNASDDKEVHRLWSDSLRLSTPSHSSYLRKCRGLDMLDKGVLEHSPFVRFAQELAYTLFLGEDGEKRETETHPAMLLFCVGVTGVTASLQRIYLQRNNGHHEYVKLVPRHKHKKNNVKRSMGHLNFDAQFWMAQPGRVEVYNAVYLSEGPEKALAVAACSRYIASFASFGVGRYDQFAHFRDLPEGKQPVLIICGDADHTAPMQAEKVKQLKKNGWRDVLHWVPGCGATAGCGCKDANDVLSAHGLQALRESLGIPAWAWVSRFEESNPLYEPPEKEWRRYPFLKKYTGR